ncbi:hypothetical protein HY311_03690 [Candidatus Nomurabacteria bacterium]|nr:hypothetical protein [Candidatus Nomurabacteria bacterium]
MKKLIIFLICVIGLGATTAFAATGKVIYTGTPIGDGTIANVFDGNFTNDWNGTNAGFDFGSAINLTSIRMAMSSFYGT